MIDHDFVMYFLAPWLVVLLIFAFAQLFILRALSRNKLFRAQNYAGKTVYYGLGFIWILWGVLILALGYLYISSHILELPTGDLAYKLLLPLVPLFANDFLFLAVPLAILCFFFGILDDLFGARGDGGFKGHIGALLHGKLTTGMGKLLGIGFTALGISALYLISQSQSIAYGGNSPAVWGALIAHIVLGGLAIALTANFLNLLDLRPARAGKMYLLLLCIATIVAPKEIATTAMLALPLMAIWSFDAGEQAMLGDAGANPAGAVIGFYFVHILSWQWLTVYVVVMLILNLASEKVSYSALIERTPFLKKLDMAGRPKP